MIIAVEGSSAAGKTTWCRQHVGDGVVPEYVPTGREPSDSDPEAQAQYRVEVNAGRWAAARSAEESQAIAVCDGDPLKLHYSWCLARIGVDQWQRWERELLGGPPGLRRRPAGLRRSGARRAARPGDVAAPA